MRVLELYVEWHEQLHTWSLKLLESGEKKNAGENDKNALVICLTFWELFPLGGHRFLSLFDSQSPKPSELRVTDVPVCLRGYWASIIYNSSAFVIKGCEGATGEQEFVQKECLWKRIYLWFSAPGVCVRYKLKIKKITTLLSEKCIKNLIKVRLWTAFTFKNSSTLTFDPLFMTQAYFTNRDVNTLKITFLFLIIQKLAIREIN